MSGQHQITLSDGRTLNYFDVGPHDGFPVIAQHGIPSSGSEWSLWASAELLDEHGVRLIAVDRPGVGASSFLRGRTVAATGADMVVLADALGLRDFVSVGYSGGAGYALATALAAGDRCRGTALISPLTPITGPHTPEQRFLMLARRAPWLFRLGYLGTQHVWRTAPEKFVERAAATLPAPDAQAIHTEWVSSAIMSTSGTARGQLLDTQRAISDWALDLTALTTPVHVWHGDADQNAPLPASRELAASLPHATLDVFPGHGHLSLPGTIGPEVIAWLATLRTSADDTPRSAHLSSGEPHSSAGDAQRNSA